jgi:hypothetical protein
MTLNTDDDRVKFVLVFFGKCEWNVHNTQNSYKAVLEKNMAFLVNNKA